MIPDRTGEDLIPIAGEIILSSVDRKWIGIPIEGMSSTMRHRERIMLEIIAPVIFLFIHREICHPTETYLTRVDEPESISTGDTDLTKDFTYCLIGSYSEKYHITSLRIELLLQRIELILTHEFEERGFRSIRFIDDIGESSCSIRFRDFSEVIDLRTRKDLSREFHCFDHVTFANSVLKEATRTIPEILSEIFEVHVEANIWLIRTEETECLFMGKS
jgi:hypothetical protein